MAKISEQRLAFLDTRDEVDVPIGVGCGTDDRGRIKWPALCACCGRDFKGNKKSVLEVLEQYPQDVFLYEVNASITTSLGMGVQTSKFKAHIPLCVSCAPKKGFFGYASTTKDGTELPYLHGAAAGSGMGYAVLKRAHMDFARAMEAIKDGRRDWREERASRTRGMSEKSLGWELRRRRIRQQRCVFCGQDMGFRDSMAERRAHKECGEYKDE